jgi:hypothetical protein
LQWQEAAMSKFHERVEAQTKQIIGQMLGDELLVQEGKKQQNEATEPGSSDSGHDQGIVRDECGQEQPRDKEPPAGEPGGPRRRPAGKEDLAHLRRINLAAVRG